MSDGYLLDENVLRELRPGGNAAVNDWHASVSTADTYISAMTYFEKRRGWERRLRADPDLAREQLRRLDDFAAEYGNRLLPMDGPIMAEVARLLGAKEKNQRDITLAATARVRGLVLVTRNVKHVRGADVRVLDPFKKPFKITTV